MKFNPQNPILVGKMKMSYEEFYDGYSNQDNQNKYDVSNVFYGVINKYPPTSKKIATNLESQKVSYTLLDVDVAIYKYDLENSIEAKKIWQRATNIKKINSFDELLVCDIYKVIFIQTDGKFSKRILLDHRLEDCLKDVSDELYIGKQFYKFISYTYACYIETKAKVKTYQEFQDYFGKDIYAITLEHGNQFLGLTWLDFIMHEPDGHLELGATSSLAGKRFEDFNTFEKGDELKITIIAEGFKDVVLKTNFKKSPATTWANMWYTKIVKKRMEKDNEKK